MREDLADGRVYLPQEDLERFGCSEEDLAISPSPERVRALIAFEVERARRLLDAGSHSSPLSEAASASPSRPSSPAAARRSRRSSAPDSRSRTGRRGTHGPTASLPCFERRARMRHGNEGGLSNLRAGDAGRRPPTSTTASACCPPTSAARCAPCTPSRAGSTTSATARSRPPASSPTSQRPARRSRRATRMTRCWSRSPTRASASRCRSTRSPISSTGSRWTSTAPAIRRSTSWSSTRRASPGRSGGSARDLRRLGLERADTAGRRPRRRDADHEHPARRARGLRARPRLPAGRGPPPVRLRGGPLQLARRRDRGRSSGSRPRAGASGSRGGSSCFPCSTRVRGVRAGDDRHLPPHPRADRP